MELQVRVAPMSNDGLNAPFLVFRFTDIIEKLGFSMGEFPIIVGDVGTNPTRIHCGVYAPVYKFPWEL